MEMQTAAYGEAIRKIGPIEDIDAIIERLDAQLDKLTQILMPVMNQYAMGEKTLSEPRPEPATPFRGRIERLRDRQNRFDTIMSEIDL